MWVLSLHQLRSTDSGHWLADPKLLNGSYASVWQKVSSASPLALMLFPAAVLSPPAENSSSLTGLTILRSSLAGVTPSDREAVVWKGAKSNFPKTSQRKKKSKEQLQLGRLVMYYYRGGGLSSKNNPAAALSPHPRCIRSKLVQKSFACATIRLLRLCWQPHRISGAVQLPAVTASVKLNPKPEKKQKKTGRELLSCFLET